MQEPGKTEQNPSSEINPIPQLRRGFTFAVQASQQLNRLLPPPKQAASRFSPEPSQEFQPGGWESGGARARARWKQSFLEAGREEGGSTGGAELAEKQTTARRRFNF